MKKWNLIHSSDFHLGYDPDGIWNNRILTSISFDILRCFLKDVVQYHPDFIIVTGDVCSCEDESLEKEIRKIFDTINIPFYLLGGNHDLKTHQSRSRVLKYFDKHFPTSRFTYSFTYKNLHFCMLEVSWVWDDLTVHAIRDPSQIKNMKETHSGIQWVLAEEHAEWLKEELKTCRDKPVVVSIHCPLFPIPDRCKYDGYRDSGILTNAEEVLDILYQHPKTCVVLSGHMHMNYIVQNKNVVQITTSALCEYPIEFRRIIVSPEYMEVETLGLSDKSFAEKSLIHGREMVRGAPEDRHFTIPLV
ncbi:MAG TPA: metallophosphoesterase [Candidatus Hydrogenedens sp.]|nr:metallophosphoesterase [Candidatus Hydrogenedens sp.]HOK09325.1 metallophosphoesterase [Candidatus Hydrogenedens sp.]HOL19814.1 metallophosphoesterase [Candidatus Hydrogenedens sp.]HPP58605.1 metallophosphoesterase [Candidatus Hydrogenedens sp.]